MLKRIMNEEVKPLCARVRIPTLVRGEELITEKGVCEASEKGLKRLFK